MKHCDTAYHQLGTRTRAEDAISGNVNNILILQMKPDSEISLPMGVHPKGITVHVMAIQTCE